MPEPLFWLGFGSAATIIIERLYRWLRVQEQETALWQRERALAVYRERHPDQRRRRCSV